MELAVTVKTAEACLAALKDNADKLNYPEWQNRSKRKTTVVPLDVSDLDVSELGVIHAILKEHDEDDAPKVKKLIKSLSDTSNTVVSRLEDFPKMLKAYLEANGKPLLHSLHTDQRGIAYLPISVEYKAEEKDRNRIERRAYVNIAFAYNTKMTSRSHSITLDQTDMRRSVPEILRRYHLMVPDETMSELYVKIKKRYEDYGAQQGEQFLCKGQANIQRSRGDDWWSSGTVEMNNMGKPTKAVLDIELLETDRWASRMTSNMYSEIYGEHQSVPTHPVLPLYSLVHHKTVWVNVINMKPYKYEEDLHEKLILPKTHVRLIGALVSNLDALRDENDADNKSKTIKAKASSSVILCKGPAGTGKTLTAEVYAEQIKRPLYEVQSGQIGTDSETMEDRLGKILARSIRLKMPLLINEADVFIKKRGDNVEQNAIVSVFLRLLEYHNGLVFLTTNRADDIDDAILSRCIAEIQYDIPKPAERLKLWRVMLSEFNAELPTKDIRRLVYAMPCVAGRDMQNLIRLTNRVCKALNEPFDIDALKNNAAFKSIKVLSDTEIDAAMAKAAALKAEK